MMTEENKKINLTKMCIRDSEGVDEDLIDEYVEAMEKYGPGYPDSGWFKRAAKLEREMRDARLEARFDEN